MGGSNAIPRAHYPKSPLGDLAAREGDGGAEGFGCLFDDELGRRWLCKLPEEEMGQRQGVHGPDTICDVSVRGRHHFGG